MPETAKNAEPKAESRNVSSGVNAGKPLLTPDEVAARLRQKPRTIRAWAQQGKLPGIKIGRDWRFDPDRLDEKLKSAA